MVINLLIGYLFGVKTIKSICVKVENALDCVSKPWACVVSARAASNCMKVPMSAQHHFHNKCLLHKCISVPTLGERGTFQCVQSTFEPWEVVTGPRMFLCVYTCIMLSGQFSKIISIIPEASVGWACILQSDCYLKQPNLDIKIWTPESARL